MANRSTFVCCCLFDSVGSGGLVWGKRPVEKDRELSYTESKQSEQSPPNISKFHTSAIKEQQQQNKTKNKTEQNKQRNKPN